MRVVVRRVWNPRGLPERDFTWTVADVEKLWVFHVHAKDSLLAYEARPEGD